MKHVTARLWLDETGQDLIEYAFLTAFIGLAGAAIFPLIVTALGNTYTSWDTSVQGVWEPCDPGAAPPCP
jgi:Flp pilus assembly pilin Flp